METKRTIGARPPINQGIDTDNALVASHAQIFSNLISQITPANTLSNPTQPVLNPYGTAPLSAIIGVWSNTTNAISVTVSNSTGLRSAQYDFTPNVGANLVPIVGLWADDNTNSATLTSSEGEYTTSADALVTGPLPDSDSSDVVNGFLEIRVNVPLADTDTIGELYFMNNFNRYCWAFDGVGSVRWYCSKEIPSFSFTRLANGNFVSVDQAHDNFKQMFQYDMTGRIYTVYILDNQAHHSLQQISNGNLILTSEYSGLRTGEAEEDATSEDGISIIDLSTGLEVAYYDAIDVLDRQRTARPDVDRSDNGRDWLHLNQTYLDENHNLVISSGRHQSCVFGVTSDANQLVFIIANHEGWKEEYQPYLLTPVDASGTPLYDFSKQEDIELANSEFWTWGQHNCVEIPNEDTNTVELFILDNGNFRSYDDTKALLPPDNHSRSVRYKIDLSNMTIQLIYEYGRDEVGSRGYSSYVCNQQMLDNGNLYVNFGGGIRNADARIVTESPGYSDIYDPLSGEEAKGHILVQEINMQTKQALFDAVIESGYLKTLEDFGSQYRYDCNCFRSLKLSIL